MAGKNPNISLSFQASAFQTEIKKMNDGLKTTKKEFEVTNLAIQANGSQLDLAANKIAGYARQAEQQRAITNKVREAVEQASRAHADAGSRVETARQAYEKAARSENTSKEELQRLRKELDNANNTYERLGKAIQTWNNKLLDSQKAENQLKVAVKQTNDEVERQRKGLELNAKSTQNVTTATGQLYNAISLLKAIAVGYAGKTLYEALIGSNAQFEQYMASFGVLLGGIQNAQRRMDELIQFAADTPFELPQLVQAEQRLLAYGVAAKDTAKVLPMLGDISLGNAEKLNMISLAYGQVITNQRLYGTELRQFAENGVPLLAELARMYGVTEAEMREMASDGKISADAVTAALERMTSEGGKFFGMMDKQSQTMTGMISTLKDNFGMFARDVGEQSFNYLKGELADLMDQIDQMSRSGELGTIAAEWGRNIANFVSFAANAIKALWDMREALAAAGAGIIAFKTMMAISGTVMAATNAIEAYTTAVKAGTTATAAFTSAMKINPWVLLASAVATIITTLITYNALTSDATNKTDELAQKTADLTDEYEQNIKAAERQSNSQLGEVEIARRLTGELDELSRKTNKTAEEKERMAGIVDQLNTKIPNLALAINSETGELDKQIGVVYEAIDAYRQLLFVKASEKKASVAAESLLDLREQREALNKELDTLLRQQSELEEQNRNSATTYKGYRVDPNAFTGLMQVETQIEKIRKSIEITDKAMSDAEKKIQESFEMSEEYTKKYGTSPTDPSTPEPYTPPPLLEPSDDLDKKREKAIKKVFDDLKFSLDMGYIAEAEYYKKLEVLRDKYYAKGSSEWQQYTLMLNQYQQKQFDDRRAASDQWISDQKYYGKLTSDEEIAAYERIRAYVTDYYKQGVIDHKEYLAQIREIDKNEFAVRKSLIENAINAEVAAEKAGLDARKAALADEEKSIKESYDKRKQAIEDYYDAIEQKEKQQDRKARLSELLKQEERYENAATREGKERLQKIRDEIESINRETQKDIQEAEKKKELSKAEAERDALEEDRLRRMDALNQEYVKLDSAQKTMLGKISEYVTVTAGAIEQVTAKIQAMVQALTGVKISNQSTTQPSGGTRTVVGTPGVVFNDYGPKNFTENADIRDYGSEIVNGALNTLRLLGG